MTRPDNRVQGGKVPHHVTDNRVGKTRNSRQHPVAAGRDGQVERVDVPRIAEHLGQLLELEQFAVRQLGELLERARGAGRLAGKLVVVYDGSFLTRDVLNQL